ncbi:MAG TPA: site-2 protease family protein [Planctomycetaceae bacterium]|nr:site-2 protease family protein [Planctomycetaceae bacterium]
MNIESPDPLAETEATNWRPAPPSHAERGDAIPDVVGPAPPVRRRVLLPVLLFLATAFSCFWVGATHWSPQEPWEDVLMDGNLLPVRQAMAVHWRQGVTYTLCLLAILLTHEMGHFIATLVHRIPASFPFFIPLPFLSPIGTMGAVIGMDSLRADRRQLFDIGIAGPLAGLLVALPVLYIGVSRLDLTTPPAGPYALDLPLGIRYLADYLHPPGYARGSLVATSQLNPYFMAGWVGLLITGLNMIPVSQLDGGHIAYTLFGRRAHWLSRFVVFGAIAYMVATRQFTWILMVAIIFLIGIRHPPTRNDQIPLGRTRTVLGYVSLVIPLFCFAPRLIVFRF